MHEALRNYYMLYHIVGDTLERRLNWGDVGRRLARSMTVLLFDDASFFRPPNHDEMRARGERWNKREFPVFCHDTGQQLLVEELRNADINPFEGITIAEVGGIVFQQNRGWQYSTPIIGEAPLIAMFGGYRNVGGTEYTHVDQERVDLSSQDEIFGDERYDYFVTNQVLSHGSGMDRMNDRFREAEAARELVEVSTNVTKRNGRMFHFDADLFTWSDINLHTLMLRLGIEQCWKSGFNYIFKHASGK